MSVPQYTTPVFVLSFSNIPFDLRSMTSVYVTFSSEKYLITKTGNDLEIGEKTITVKLSQEETSKLCGFVNIQANWIDEEGNRIASEIVKQTVTDNLLKRVIS